MMQLKGVGDLLSHCLTFVALSGSTYLKMSWESALDLNLSVMMTPLAF